MTRSVGSSAPEGASDDKKQCAGRCRSDNGYHRHPCSKSGKYHEDGKDWCGSHRPSRIKAKVEARNAKWDAEWKARLAELLFPSHTMLPERRTRQRSQKITAAREAVIAAAKTWEALGGENPLRDILKAVQILNALEATNQAGEASPRAPEVRDV